MGAWHARRLLIILLGVLLPLAACGSDGGIEVRGVWGRESPSMAQNSAFYMELRNEGDGGDALIGVQSEACSRVELHESSMDDNGVMRMAPVPGGRIPLPAGAAVSLAPGGLHVMCLGVTEPFALGETIVLTLEFAEHEPLEVEAEIRRDAP
ncbi:MAG: copper chaperone PCu(A)C [Anaerolineae bacterium]|nr:copper chaperone PCu(A)C [Anaerolineae bacterium]